jgi:hypothetical protein
MTDPMQTEREADLHAQIMRLRCNVPEGYAPGKADEAVYRIGHRDARHAAAELAAAYESERASELRSLRDALTLAKARIAELEGAGAICQPGQCKHPVACSGVWDKCVAATPQVTLSLEQARFIFNALDDGLGAAMKANEVNAAAILNSAVTVMGQLVESANDALASARAALKEKGE